MLLHVVSVLCILGISLLSKAYRHISICVVVSQLLICREEESAYQCSSEVLDDEIHDVGMSCLGCYVNDPFVLGERHRDVGAEFVHPNL